MHKLSDDDLKGLVLEETGAGEESPVAGLVVACIKQLKKFAKWDALPTEDKPDKPLVEIAATTPNHQSTTQSQLAPQRLGLNLGYTINLNLPATSDPAVFNAIFRALKEHLLKVSNE